MPNNYESIALASSTEVLDDKNEFMFKVLNEANRWTESEVELAQDVQIFKLKSLLFMIILLFHPHLNLLNQS